MDSNMRQSKDGEAMQGLTESAKEEEGGCSSSSQRPGIVERTVRYSLEVIQLYRKLERESVGRILGKQLLRAATSIGANVHEAQGGQSRADFICKISIAYKEARESVYWLRLIHDAQVGNTNEVERIQDETNQLVRILSSILLTSKQSKN
jgi:four helix bundle protein